MMKINRRTALMGAVAMATLPISFRHAKAASHSVTISGFAFQPANLTIAAGDSVEFTNNDAAPHTASAASGAFDTGRLNKGESTTIRFDSAGTFDYVCAFHGNMKGKITVT